MVMSKIVKKKWLNALRSGDYKQTTGALQDEKGYCCLGVLCEITGNASNRVMGSCGFPKTDVIDTPLEFCGLSSNMQNKLADLNDGGSGFDAIASYISRNIKAK